eukprot:g50321.t1
MSVGGSIKRTATQSNRLLASSTHQASLCPSRRRRSFTSTTSFANPLNGAHALNGGAHQTAAATKVKRREWEREPLIDLGLDPRLSRRRVYMIGGGMVPVTRKMNVTLASMGVEAVDRALKDANLSKSAVSALFTGNMLSGQLSRQQHLGAKISWSCGLDGVETFTAEACCGAGGAALRLGYLALMSGLHDTVIVCGVEMMTHTETRALTEALATASHWITEGGKGETFISLNGALMQLYMDRYGISAHQFAPFAVVAHHNAGMSEHALFKNKSLDISKYESSPIICHKNTPIRLFDASATCDGAAAVILTTNTDHVRNAKHSVVLRGSGASSDALPIAAREDPLALKAVTKSTQQALKEAGMTHSDIQIFEGHDAYTSMIALSMEAAGFVKRGEATYFAKEGNVSLTGTLPVSTFGGLKARGHPVGASGVYQAAEVFLQLTGRAGRNQIPNRPEVAMTQSIGGAAGSVFTHIFTANT